MHVAPCANIVPDGNYAFFAAVTQPAVMGENLLWDFRAQFGDLISVGCHGFIEFECLKFQEVIN